MKTLKFFLSLALLFGLAMGSLMFMQGCSEEKPVEPIIQADLPDSNIDMQAERVNGPAWENNVLSEVCYALSQSRSGYSTKSWNGYAMGDWPYPWQGDCCNALGKVTSYMYGGCTSCRGSLGLWLGQYQQGGECKFFVNLVLYRSSYGFPGGHLILPGGTYSYYGAQNWRNAGPGWIIQSASMPHTAIVVANYGYGLSVIDANWVGGRGSYAIARHIIYAGTLDANGFVAYRPTDACVLTQ